jgi:hypothetical protein
MSDPTPAPPTPPGPLPEWLRAVLKDEWPTIARVAAYAVTAGLGALAAYLGVAP